MKVLFPYGKKKLTYDFDDTELVSVLTSSIDGYVSKGDETELVKNAMDNPVNSERLCDIAKGKNKVVIIASDHTRPVPSKVIMPLMLGEIRKGNPDADITILIATAIEIQTKATAS